MHPCQLALLFNERLLQSSSSLLPLPLTPIPLTVLPSNTMGPFTTPQIFLCAPPAWNVSPTLPCFHSYSMLFKTQMKSHLLSQVSSDSPGRGARPPQTPPAISFLRWHPTAGFLPGESQGQRSLEGISLFLVWTWVTRPALAGIHVCRRRG